MSVANEREPMNQNNSAPELEPLIFTCEGSSERSEQDTEPLNIRAPRVIHVRLISGTL